MSNAEAILAFGVCLPDGVILPWQAYEGVDEDKPTIRKWWLQATSFEFTAELDEFSDAAAEWAAVHKMPIIHPYSSPTYPQFIISPPGFSRSVSGVEVASITQHTLKMPSLEELTELTDFIRLYINPLNYPTPDSPRELPSERPAGWWLVANEL